MYNFFRISKTLQQSYKNVHHNPDQEKILALLAAWSFDRKPTAECGNFSIENVISITKKQALKAVSVF